MSATSLDQHIESTPDVCGGKARISGRRITVQDIVVWHQHERLSADQIVSKFELSLADVYAALAYYFDHQPEIDQAIMGDVAHEDDARKAYPSKIPTSARRPLDSSPDDQEV